MHKGRLIQPSVDQGRLPKGMEDKSKLNPAVPKKEQHPKKA